MRPLFFGSVSTTVVLPSASPEKSFMPQCLLQFAHGTRIIIDML